MENGWDVVSLWVHSTTNLQCFGGFKMTKSIQAADTEEEKRTGRGSDIDRTQDKETRTGRESDIERTQE